MSDVWCFRDTEHMAAYMLARVCRFAQQGDWFAAGYELAVVDNLQWDGELLGEPNMRRYALCEALKDAISEQSGHSLKDSEEQLHP